MWRALGSFDPGWLLCDGAAVSRTTYADLFAVISTTFGAGDGSTTFNVPNLIEKYPAGANSGAGFGRGTAAGAKDHTHAGNSHTHSVTQNSAHSAHSSVGAHTHDAHGSASLTGGSNNTSLSGPTTHSASANHAHDAHSAHSGAATQAATGTTGSNEPPYMAMLPLVRT